MPVEMTQHQMGLIELHSEQRNGEPAQLAQYHYAAYYGVLRERLAPYGLSDEHIATIAIEQEAIIEAHKITDWTSNVDVQKTIKPQLDNQLYEAERETGTPFDIDVLDHSFEHVEEIAKARDSGST